MDEPQTIDLSNWMGQISEQIGDLPLRAVAIPGTHDSAMYPGMLPADYARCQNIDFTGQLNMGARYFDFRCGYIWEGGEIGGPDGFCDPENGGECWTCPDDYNRTWDPVTSATACAKRGFLGISWFGKTSPATFVRKLHGCGYQHDQGPATLCVGNFPSTPAYLMTGHGDNPAYVVDVTIAQAIDQITTWLGDHPHEAVILNVSPVSQADQVNKVVVDSVASTAYPASSTPPQNATINDVLGKIVMIGGSTGMFGGNCIRSIGYQSSTDGIEDIDTMMRYLDQQLDSVRPAGQPATSDPTLLVTTACLTPDGAGHGVVPGNPKDLADSFNPDMVTKLTTAPTKSPQADVGWEGRAINIVTVDYIGTDVSKLAETIIRANFHMSPAPTAS